MDQEFFFDLIKSIVKTKKTFFSVNFGCRVNAAETNQLSQILVDNNFKTTSEKPDVIIANTCSITKKGEIESLSRIRILNKKYPDAKILVTGCANLKKISQLKNVYIFDNNTKEKILKNTNCLYTSDIKDKFSQTHRYILKIQSGCNQFCSYCTVPFQRQYLWSLPIEDAVNTANKVVKKGYKEIIITGVNLKLYKPGLSNLIENLLTKTSIPLVSFGSIPLNCIDKKFLKLLLENKDRISSFLHIPLQSGSDKILKLMNRPYTQKDILKIFYDLKSTIDDLTFGTDIIVGFPGETDFDFQETLSLCQNIGFKKIHTFKYSSRPNTQAKFFYNSQPKIKKEILNERSKEIRDLIK